MVDRISDRQIENGSAAAPTPPPLTWYLHVEGKNYGPFNLADMRRLIAKAQVQETDLVCSPGARAWITVAQDPVLARCFSLPVRATRRKNKIASVAIFGGFFLFALGWVAWPYFATFQLFNAVRDGNILELEKRVAWNEVRQGIKGDLSAALLGKTTQETLYGKKDSFAGALETFLGPTMIDRLVDSYVTPQSLALAIQSAKKESRVQATDDKQKPETKKLNPEVNWNQVQYAFFTGPLEFRVDVLPKNADQDGKPVGLLFAWSGDWKLTRILLPDGFLDSTRSADALFSESAPKKAAPDNVEGILSRLKPPAAEPPQTGRQAVPPEPSPLRVEIISKSFKPSNYRANDYHDQITLTLKLENVSGSDIRAFDGVVKFVDLLDNEIMNLRLAINEPVRAGATKIWHGAVDYNEFKNDHRNLRAAEKENVKLTFAPRKVLFSDGTTKEYR